MITYRTETRDHLLACANCGNKQIFENILGNRRPTNEKVKSKQKPNNSDGSNKEQTA
jgi:DNA-directed RNA polymerase subunit M/transcription elongation factor TFIIS